MSSGVLVLLQQVFTASKHWRK